jgi:anaerobic dimethyl sulfoxide reductase subunit C (anchor subunit)
MLREWPLVAFTVAGQAAVGIFLFAGLPLLLPAGAGGTAAAREARLVVLAVVLGLLAMAALLSLFHLHHPFRARRVLSNMRTSWLSREIFFELGFMALVSLGLILVWRGQAGIGITKGVMIAAAVLGVLFILSMSKLYMLPSVPPWNRAYTPLSFFLTSLALGALSAALIRGLGAEAPSRSGVFVLLAFIFAAAEAALSFLAAPGHGIFGYRPGPSLRPPGGAHRTLHLTRLALLLMGLSLIRGAMIAGEGRAGIGLGENGLLTIALALVLAGQIAGRFLFYGLFGRPGR